MSLQLTSPAFAHQGEIPVLVGTYEKGKKASSGR